MRMWKSHLSLSPLRVLISPSPRPLHAFSDVTLGDDDERLERLRRKRRRMNEQANHATVVQETPGVENAVRVRTLEFDM